MLAASGLGGVLSRGVCTKLLFKLIPMGPNVGIAMDNGAALEAALASEDDPR